MLIPGGCHCGNIAFTLDWLPHPTEIPARACTCSFCVKHGGGWTSCPGGTLQVAVRDAARVGVYEFGTRTAQFHVCQACGVVPLVTCEIERRLHAVVNVNAFEGVDPALLRRSSADYEAEKGPEARIARRRRSWIGNVQYREGSG